MSSIKVPLYVKSQKQSCSSCFLLLLEDFWDSSLCDVTKSTLIPPSLVWIPYPQQGDDRAVFVQSITVLAGGCNCFLFLNVFKVFWLINRVTLLQWSPWCQTKIGRWVEQGLQHWQSCVGCSRCLEAKCNLAWIAENNRNQKWHRDQRRTRLVSRKCDLTPHKFSLPWVWARQMNCLWRRPACRVWAELARGVWSLVGASKDYERHL